MHFGDALNTVDLDGPPLSAAQLADVEKAANGLVWENRPIRAYWVDEEERGKVPLRRSPAVAGATRIVEIDKFDWSACGGTHVRRTGEIGLIALVRVEKHRGRSRVHFVCGRRALADAARRRGSCWRRRPVCWTAAWMTCRSWCRSSRRRCGSAERELKALREELVAYQAWELLAEAETAGGVRLVAREMADSEPAAVQGLARALICRAGCCRHCLAAREGVRGQLCLPVRRMFRCTLVICCGIRCGGSAAEAAGGRTLRRAGVWRRRG